MENKVLSCQVVMAIISVFIHTSHTQQVNQTEGGVQCYDYFSSGMEGWAEGHKVLNCTEEGATCKLLIEPSLDGQRPTGFTASCSNFWQVDLLDCWNECRTNYTIGVEWKIHWDVICSFCCHGDLCNHPDRFEFPQYTVVKEGEKEGHVHDADSIEHDPQNASHNMAAITSSLCLPCIVTLVAMVALTLN